MLISSKRVISKTLKSFGITESGMEADLIELVGDAVEWLGNRHKTFYTEFVKAKVVEGKLQLDLDYSTIIDIFSLDGTCCNWYCRNTNYAQVEGPIRDVVVHVRKQAVDKYPLIWDNFKYVSAIRYFLLTALMEEGWRHPNPEITLTYAIQMKTKYFLQAKNLLFPQPQELEEFIQNYTSLRSQ